jgi:hypothetical protein
MKRKRRKGHEYYNFAIAQFVSLTISNNINYIQLCDLEYLDNLEDDPYENKDRI